MTDATQQDQTDSTTDESTEATTVEAAPVYEKGSWQEKLQTSTTLKARGEKAVKRAGQLLWDGAKDAIESWSDSGSETDSSGENLYGDVLTALGKPRKGDASKVKTVALAVRDHGLVLSVHPNLSKAYAEAVRLTKTQQQQADEDDAAEKALEALAESVPNSTTTVEGAALILLSKGIDGMVVAILDALGADNEAAHRSVVRAFSTEIAARIQAKKPKPAPKAPAKDKTGAKAAKKATPAKKAAPSSTKAKPTTKAKPVAKKAAPVAEVKAKPEQAETKAKPVVIQR